MRSPREAIVSALVLIAMVLVSGCGEPLPSASPPSPAPVDGYRIVSVYPHDPGAFTEGLIYRDGFLYESTGLHGESSLRRVRLKTGVVVQQHDLDVADFGEGLTEWKGRLIQLTWKSGYALLYDLRALRPMGDLPYSGEGWGLTRDGQQLIASDGTAHLRFLDPKTLAEIRSVEVTDNGESISALNELEYVEGEIYANVWHTDRIARISPDTGEVKGWIDLEGLHPSTDQDDPEAVLNGIAYDPSRKRLFVTGKLWPKLYEIEIVPKG